MSDFFRLNLPYLGAQNEQGVMAVAESAGYADATESLLGVYNSSLALGRKHLGVIT